MWLAYVVSNVDVASTGSPISAWMPMIQSLSGVLVGGLVTYLVNTRNDRRKDVEETRRLALSVAAEVRAGLEALALSMKINEGLSQADRLEGLRYLELPADYAPITREASKNVGRFPAPIAELIAQYLGYMGNFKQHADAWRRMHVAGALTDERFEAKIVSLAPLIDALRRSANELQTAIDQHYKRTAA